MARGWTPERKARQAELIRTWKPWEKSTGPRSDEGKIRSAQNSYTGGTWKLLRELSKSFNARLRDHRERLRQVQSDDF